MAANRVLLVPLAFLLLSGCASLSTLQTPSTVPKGQTRFGIGAEAVGISSDGDAITVPQFEFSARYGLTDAIDIGAKLYAIGVELGLKYQFLRGPLDIAIAPAVSYISVNTSVSDGSGGEDDASVSVAFLHLPLLLGYNVSDRLTVGFGPKLLYVISTASASSMDATDTVTSDGAMVGGFLNIPWRVGDAFWIAPEVNVYKPIGEEGLVWQGGLVFLFGGGPPPQPTPNP